MPRYTVTILERVTQYRSKVFDAPTADDARQAAYADNSWTDLDGWEDGYEAAETDIEDIEILTETTK